MAPKCYICNIYVKKNVSLYRIPARNDEYSDRCGLWLKLLQEKPENMHNIRICSVHFFNSNLFLQFISSTPTYMYILLQDIILKVSKNSLDNEISR